MIQAAERRGHRVQLLAGSGLARGPEVISPVGGERCGGVAEGRLRKFCEEVQKIVDRAAKHAGLEPRARELDPERCGHRAPRPAFRSARGGHVARRVGGSSRRSASGRDHPASPPLWSSDRPEPSPPPAARSPSTGCRLHPAPPAAWEISGREGAVVGEDPVEEQDPGDARRQQTEADQRLERPDEPKRSPVGTMSP